MITLITSIPPQSMHHMILLPVVCSQLRQVLLTSGIRHPIAGVDSATCQPCCLVSARNALCKHLIWSHHTHPVLTTSISSARCCEATMRSARSIRHGVTMPDLRCISMARPALLPTC